MKPRDLFEVAVRIAGVFTLIWGVWDLANAALFYADYWRNVDMSFRYYLIYGWISIAMGLILIRIPWILVNFAYPPEEQSDAAIDEEPENASEKTNSISN